MGVTDYSICCGGLAQEPVLKEETHCLHQASLLLEVYNSVYIPSDIWAFLRLCFMKICG